MHSRNISFHQCSHAQSTAALALLHMRREGNVVLIYGIVSIATGVLHPHGRASENVKICSQLALNEMIYKEYRCISNQLKASSQICGNVNTCVERLPWLGPLNGPSHGSRLSLLKAEHTKKCPLEHCTAKHIRHILWGGLILPKSFLLSENLSLVGKTARGPSIRF